MVATRTGQQQALSDLPGVDVKRKTGGGKPADEKPEEEQRPLKRTKGGGRSGKKAAAAAEARKSTAQDQGQDTAADDARAVAAAVDTGEDPQEKLQKDTKQTGLKTVGGASGDVKAHHSKPDGGSGSGDREPHGDKAHAHRSGKSKPHDDGQGGGGSGDAKPHDDEKAGGKGSGDDARHDNKGGSSEAKDVKLDKSDHGNAKPAGAKRGGASGKGSETRAAKEEAEQHPGKVVKINRAPVLTLWVKVVAECEGYDEDAALTFGKAVSGMLAQSKGRRLGVFDGKEHEQQEPGEPQLDRAEVFGMKLKVVREGDAVRATEGGDQAMNPGKVRGYLHRAFGDDLGDVQAAMGELAAAYGKDDIGSNAYRLYENFRPTVSDGTRGWGAKADLDLGLLHALAHQHQQGN